MVGVGVRVRVRVRVRVTVLFMREGEEHVAVWRTATFRVLK